MNAIISEFTVSVFTTDTALLHKTLVLISCTACESHHL